MKLSMIINSIKKAFLVSGYNRTAYELLQLSDRQLEDLGISRDLLMQGYRAYPWRFEEQAQGIPDFTDDIIDNLSQLNDKSSNQTPLMPYSTKAAA